MQKNKIKINSGFTIIEALIVLFVFSVVTTAFYAVFTVGLNFIMESKNRLGAVYLANERMEIIRNLKYDDVGIVGGIPSGTLPAEEDVIASKRKYHVKTFVQYIDDPFDGISPIDLDYKRVKVTISWPGPKKKTSTVSLVTRFVPPGVEQNVAGGGALSINIMDGKGIGVPQTSVHVTNSAISPSVNVTAMTDNTGNLLLPGAKQSLGNYYVEVSKEGYENVETINPTLVTYTVTDTPASVVGGMMNVKSIVQNKLTGFTINSLTSSGEPLPGVNFHAEGGRIMGYDMLQSPAAPEYNLKIDSTTDSAGKKEFQDISPGQIFITPVGPPPAGYVLVNVDYFTEYDTIKNEFSFILNPDEPKEVRLKYADENQVSLLATIRKDADNTLLEDAKITLSDAGDYSEEIITKKDGTAFFPGTSTPIALGAYNIVVTADGYADYTEENVTLDKLILKEIKLIAL